MSGPIFWIVTDFAEIKVISSFPELFAFPTPRHSWFCNLFSVFLQLTFDFFFPHWTDLYSLIPPCFLGKLDHMSLQWSYWPINVQSNRLESLLQYFKEHTLKTPGIFHKGRFGDPESLDNIVYAFLSLQIQRALRNPNVTCLCHGQHAQIHKGAWWPAHLCQQRMSTDSSNDVKENTLDSSPGQTLQHVRGCVHARRWTLSTSRPGKDFSQPWSNKSNNISELSALLK